MIPAPVPADEAQRLAALDSYAVLDTAPESVFDDLTSLAAGIAGTPVALISLVDATRQWFKSAHGISTPETPRNISVCSHAIVQSTPLVIADARLDARFADNPLVTGDLHLRFYAGAQLIDSEGYALGTLCVIDREPRAITQGQLRDLQRLARQVVGQLELRRSRERLLRVAAAHERLQAVVGDDVECASRGIVRTTQMLLQTALSPEQRELASSLQACGDHVLSVIESVLDYHQPEVGNRQRIRRPLSVIGLAAEAAALHATEAREREVTLDLQYSIPDRHLRLGDAERLTQALGRLLANALEHAHRGVITIRVEAHDDRPDVLFEVIDNGRSGTRSQQLPADADAAWASGHGGSALGLVIAQRSVAMMGGRTGVRRNAEGDWVFWMSVPLSKPSAAAALEAPTEPEQHISDLHVLVAEENDVIRLLVVTLLQRLGCAVTVRDSAASALEAMRGARFDAVLLPCDASGIDSFALTRQIRSGAKDTAGVPIIALSAGPFDADRDQCLRAGMTDLLSLSTLRRDLGASLRRLTG